MHGFSVDEKGLVFQHNNYIQSVDYRQYRQ
jgi:hypothetical protein